MNEFIRSSRVRSSFFVGVYLLHHHGRRPRFRALFCSLALILVGGARAQAEFLVGLGSTSTFTNALVTFDSTPGSTPTAPVGITGVTGRLLDIDYRPSTGALYGLSDAGMLYTINTATGVAALASTLSTPLSGNQFAIDFNPVADRLRVVSDTTQNLRINVDTGATTVDGNLSAAGVVGAAYTNSFAGASSTTLYDLQRSGTTFLLSTQNPPNTGTLMSIGSTGISSPSSLVGFDISGMTGTGFVAVNSTTGIVNNSVSLLTIDLTTGNVQSFTPVGLTGFQIRGLAAPLGVAVPEPASLALLAIGMIGVGFAARRSAKHFD